MQRRLQLCSRCWNLREPTIRRGVIELPYHKISRDRYLNSNSGRDRRVTNPDILDKIPRNCVSTTVVTLELVQHQARAVAAERHGIL